MIKAISNNIPNIVRKSQIQHRELYTGDKAGLKKPIYYYPVSFCKKYTNEEKIQKIGEENFPNAVIIQQFREAQQTGESLNSIHLKYYNGLKECNTLDEVKKRYPELSSAIDARETEEKYRNSTLLKISKGEYKGLTINNVTLELIKALYGELKGLNHAESYYGIGRKPLTELFEILKIKRLNSRYIMAAVNSSDEVSGAISRGISKHLEDIEVRRLWGETSKKNWAKDDGKRREKAKETARRVLQSNEVRLKAKETTKSDEFKVKMSKASADSWAKDDGKRRNISSYVARKYLQSEETIAKVNAVKQTADYREKQRQITLARYRNNPKYGEAQKLAWARHPEITSFMSEVSKEFVGMPVIMEKKEKGIDLSNKEQKRLAAFYKRCHELWPEAKQIIGDEHHKILVEWGIVKE